MGGWVGGLNRYTLLFPPSIHPPTQYRAPLVAVHPSTEEGGRCACCGSRTAGQVYGCVGEVGAWVGWVELVCGVHEKTQRWKPHARLPRRRRRRRRRGGGAKGARKKKT